MPKAFRSRSHQRGCSLTRRSCLSHRCGTLVCVGILKTNNDVEQISSAVICSSADSRVGSAGSVIIKDSGTKASADVIEHDRTPTGQRRSST
ncbi:hypothetical protein MTO96_000286 [Rhipicephalus appendiculatus]